MNRPVVYAMPGSELLGKALCTAMDAAPGQLEHRKFPDEETYLRIAGEVAGRDVVLVGGLDRPDCKLLPLLFAAATLRELGARKIGLVAPYLAYMRQDDRFHPGEAVTSRIFAGIISGYFDWLVTVDPHLHRYHALKELYRVPSQVVHAAPFMAAWIRENVERPIIIGPDKESEQWVAEVASAAGAPFLVCEKERSGDREVRISIPNDPMLGDRRCVLVDDVASSGRTLAVAAKQLLEMGLDPPDCVVTHPLFAGDATTILGGLVRRIISTNTIAHATNGIDMTMPIALTVRALL